MGNDTDHQSANPDLQDKGKKAGAFSLSATPVAEEQEPLDIHKFGVGQESTKAAASKSPAFEDLGPLPASYHEDMIFLVARDPRWLFAYWDFDWIKYRASAMRGGRTQYFLKIFKADGAQETIVEITPEARNWYVQVSAPDTFYFAEIGFFARDGGWAPIVSSGAARTPPDTLAEDAGAEFATVPAQLSFQRMLDLVKQQMQEGEGLLHAVSRISGAGREIAFQPGKAPTWTDEQRSLLAALVGHSLIDRMGMGSDEFDQLLRKQLAGMPQADMFRGFLEELSSIFSPGVSSLYSGIGASWSAQPFGAKYERGFFMHVNAEIIFYGGTDPDAKVSVDGKEIKLSPDGTFRYHFALPDGDFTIPIVARSPDGVEERSATLSFGRSTGKTGEVGDTGQPPYLQPLIGRK